MFYDNHRFTAVSNLESYAVIKHVRGWKSYCDTIQVCCLGYSSFNREIYFRITLNTIALIFLLFSTCVKILLNVQRISLAKSFTVLRHSLLLPWVLPDWTHRAMVTNAGLGRFCNRSLTFCINCLISSSVLMWWGNSLSSHVQPASWSHS